MDINLRYYRISETVGFLLEEPLTELPSYFEAWSELGKNVPHYLSQHELRSRVEKMPLLDYTQLSDYHQYCLAHLLLSFIGAGYVWQEGDKGVVQSVPASLAIPWCGVSDYLGIHPIISHTDFALVNWTKIEPQRPLELCNLQNICRLPGGKHMEWFSLVTVQMEMDFASGIRPLLSAIDSVEHGNDDQLIQALRGLQDTLCKMKKTISRMHDELDADVFYNVIRPYLNGWGGAGSPLPQGLIYEGVSEQPVQLSGGSAAQSTSMQFIDHVLGIEHKEDHTAFLKRMRDYMPAPHRQFLQDLSNRPRVKEYVEASDNKELVKEYNLTVEAVKNFRSYHIQLVAKYIVVQSNRVNRNKSYESVEKKGTGGQSLMPFLKGIRNTTAAATVQKEPLLGQVFPCLIFLGNKDELDADVFYNVIRPYLNGWGGAGSPLPQGLIYEGVSDQPVQLSGGSAAQSTSMQFIDHVLGIVHKEDHTAFLKRMRDYMPAPHRQFLQDLSNRPRVKEYVEASDNKELVKEYNLTVEAVKNFRSYHIQLVAKYIVVQSNRVNRNKSYESVEKKGTGGQSLMPFLKGIRNTTAAATVQKEPVT
ncbi:indoleamine 2,3-dioxygenase 2 [Lingula anatina]|uniref:Indoleamine 2,3-dioxygenase 2 n=1 Tax=Lingula anatina TaxID=7574 RepID=A0A1S3KI68_LINAN|nr:indoleamine 2,3-dioxygenase 2 [Lingula anatina]|eukprot:XP_013422192.1 indoleamine 2,3-dioxygenase 2 [Lingula anatina]